MFNTRKPRKFRSVHIYTDESREKLEKLVRDVKREQGMLEEENKPYDPAKFKGKFGQYTPRVFPHGMACGDSTPAGADACVALPAQRYHLLNDVRQPLGTNSPTCFEM